MVSLWPWKTRDTSPASFEKALAALATRIAATQARLDHTRAAFRRVRLLATLYLTFAYLAYAIVLVLVVGRRGMGPWEWSGVAGGPLLLYAVRAVLAAVYTYRIDARAALLRDLQRERAQTIQKLKDATKYESTQQLLEKYGGGAGEGGEAKKGGSRGSSHDTRTAGPRPAGPAQHGGRTHHPVPATANIPARGAPPPSSPPAPRHGGTPRASLGQALDGAEGDGGSAGGDADAEFAPNAFEPGQAPADVARLVQGAAVPAAASPPESHWYDRVLDLLLGEDETATKNRIVLLCGRCRLVNGQAPPGTRSLAEVGAWRCMGCGALNGGAAAGAQAGQDAVAEAEAEATVTEAGEE